MEMASSSRSCTSGLRIGGGEILLSCTESILITLFGAMEKLGENLLFCWDETACWLFYGEGPGLTGIEKVSPDGYVILQIALTPFP